MSPRRNASSHRYDYRSGVVERADIPRAYQPRIDGPPLLFLTDIRMTILVNLALADGPIRQTNLWKHMGKSAKTALYPLVNRGLVVMWDAGKNRKFVALDPCHPAAVPLKKLLQVIGSSYPGFSAPPYQPDDRDAGDAPVRPRRLRDVRYTFGDPIRTMSLLCVYLRPGIFGKDISRIVSYVQQTSSRNALFMFQAFGLLTTSKAILEKKRGTGFYLNDEHQLVPYIADVLAALAAATPTWVYREKSQRSEKPYSREPHRSRRKTGRWKW